MRPGIGKAFSFWIVGAFALVALLAPTSSVAAQSTGTGTVTAYSQYCTGLSSQGLMGQVGPDCVGGPATFTFYLHGDGTDDSWTLSVGESGEASMELQAGTYDVWTPGGAIFNVTVPENGATSFAYGFPVQAPAPPPAPAPDPAPDPDPAPAPETATLNVNTFACTGLNGAPIALGEVGPDCTQISTNLDFYLWGDGTDDHWNLTTSADGPVSIDLQVGGYDVLNTNTWERVGMQLPSGGTTLNIGYAAAAPAPAPDPEPAPAPDTATLNVNTFACTGVNGAPIALVDIGPDCTQISTNLDFYLWGDGTDDHWNLTTSADGPVSIDLQVGGYEVLNTNTWERLGMQLPAGGTTLNIGYAADGPAPAPDPDPARETATLNVNTFACTGINGAPIALTDIGPDCTQIGTNLDFYLWGDGTDDHWNLTTSSDGPVSIDLQVGGYEVLNTNTWERIGMQLPSGGTTINIGYAAVAPDPEPVMGSITLNTYSCTGINSGAIILTDIGDDCTRVSSNLDLYLWGDGTDDSWSVTTNAAGPVTAQLPVGDYLAIDNFSWQRVNVSVTEGGGTVSIGLPAYYNHAGMIATP